VCCIRRSVLNRSVTIRALVTLSGVTSLGLVDHGADPSDSIDKQVA
jgi:hypothetical protein